MKLYLLLVIVPGSNEGNNEHCYENGSTLNPGYVEDEWKKSYHGSMATDTQAHTRSSLIMKSSRAWKKKMQKGVFLTGGFLLVPNCYSLASKSMGVNP